MYELFWGTTVAWCDVEAVQRWSPMLTAWLLQSARGSTMNEWSSRALDGTVRDAAGQGQRKLPGEAVHACADLSELANGCLAVARQNNQGFLSYYIDCVRV